MKTLKNRIFPIILAGLAIGQVYLSVVVLANIGGLLPTGPIA